MYPPYGLPIFPVLVPGFLRALAWLGASRRKVGSRPTLHSGMIRPAIAGEEVTSPSRGTLAMTDSSDAEFGIALKSGPNSSGALQLA